MSPFCAAAIFNVPSSRRARTLGNFLDYKGALAAGLPIGSGEIESGHRYVFQDRLKIAGGWWKVENLKKMIALQVVRVNRGWEDYWSNVHQRAA
jgi:hypothetical protein